MAYVDMYITSKAGAVAYAVGASHILREASASLSVLLRWAIPEPPFAEWAASTVLTLFCFKHKNADAEARRHNVGLWKVVKMY